MARTARLNVPGAIYHVITRFADHRWYLRDDEERDTYLRMFGHALSKSDWRCFGYALMSNHLHHAMRAGHMPMESWTRRVNSQFARWLNERTGRIGSVFADRAKDVGFAPDRLGVLLAYIHNNPVRAGVVARAIDSTWTSHRAYVGLATPPRWLNVKDGLRRMGFGDGVGFDAWVDNTPGERADIPFAEIQREARRRGGLVLATPQSDAVVPLVAPPFACRRPDPRVLIDFVARVTGVPVPLICSRRRLEHIRSARKIVVACGLAHGLTKSALARALGLAAQAVHKISERPSTELELRIAALITDQLTC